MRRPGATCVPMLALVCWALTGAGAGAEVRDRSSSGFTVKTTVNVAAPPPRVYQELLDPGSWWDKEHTYSGEARNMTLVAQPGGCFCEKVPGGGAVEHGRVINVSTGRMIRISAALGPLQELAVTGTMTWQIDPAAQGKGSTLTMTYAAGGYAPGGLDKLADIVDQVLGRQVQLLKAYAEKSR
jgi:uncharacterized protein YndB with AHSA1/START domain